MTSSPPPSTASIESKFSAVGSQLQSLFRQIRQQKDQLDAISYRLANIFQPLGPAPFSTFASPYPHYDPVTSYAAPPSSALYQHNPYSSTGVEYFPPVVSDAGSLGDRSNVGSFNMATATQPVDAVPTVLPSRQPPVDGSFSSRNVHREPECLSSDTPRVRENAARDSRTHERAHDNAVYVQHRPQRSRSRVPASPSRCALLSRVDVFSQLGAWL